MSTPEIRALQYQVSQLQQQVAQLAQQAAQPGEQASPNYLTVSPSGSVSGIVASSVQLPEAPSGLTLSPANAVSWKDSGGVFREYSQGFFNGGSPPGHGYVAGTVADGNDYAYIICQAQENAPAGTARIYLYAVSSGGGGLTAVPLLFDNGVSGFMRNLYQNVASVGFPGWGVSRTPRTQSGTFVTGTVGLATVGGGTYDQVQVWIGGQMYQQYINLTYGTMPVGFTSELYLPFFFFVPMNTGYYFTMPHSAGVSGFPLISGNISEFYTGPV